MIILRHNVEKGGRFYKKFNRAKVGKSACGGLATGSAITTAIAVHARIVTLQPIFGMI